MDVVSDAAKVRLRTIKIVDYHFTLVKIAQQSYKLAKKDRLQRSVSTDCRSGGSRRIQIDCVERLLRPHDYHSMMLVL